MFISEKDLKTILRSEREAFLSAISSMVNTRKTHEDRKLSAKEAAAYLGISLSTLYKNIKHVPHRKFGKKLVFVLKELNQFDFASIPQQRTQYIPAPKQ